MTHPAGVLDKVDALASPHGLMAMGGLHTQDAKTIVLIGTAAHFLSVFRCSAECQDDLPDPINRWSERVVPLLAKGAGASDIAYPFGRPPYQPFIAWAKETGEAFDSPTGMLVHIRAGMMISYRGALIFDGHVTLPKTAHSSPCTTCNDRSCETACPVGALSPDQFYDVPGCKSFLQSSLGDECMTNGCVVRRACPVSQSFGRPTAQSALHMRAFLGEA